MSKDIDFTGERFIPDQTSKRIADDHFSRYRFALQFVRSKFVLDVACGSGYGSALLKQEGRAMRVDGVDVDPDLVEYAKSHFQIDGVNFFVDDLANHHLRDTYDVIISFETIEHIDDYRKALHNLYGLLTAGGVLVISTPNRLITSPKLASFQEKPDNPFHVREFVLPELIGILRDARFTVDPGEVYGQRQQQYFGNKYLRRIYKILFQPDVRLSPEVRKLHAQPRYIIVVARKLPTP